jgi:acyl carrier protein
MATTTEEKVRQVILEQLGVYEEEITLTATFEDLDCDSLDNVLLIMAFEERFDIEIPDQDAEPIKTVQDAVSYIDKRLRK